MATEDARKLFVAGLSESISEDVLRQVFEATGGKVVDVSMPRDRATGRPRGFGFVTFATAEDASQARSKLDGSLQAGRPISVRPFSSEPPRRGEGVGGGGGGDAPRTQQPDDRTLYVGNLPYDITQQELTQLFADNGAGAIARINLPIGPDGRPRGFGFVQMPTSEAANQALATLRNFEVRGRKLMLNIAHPRGAGGGPGGPGGPRPPRRDEGFGGGAYPPMPPSGLEFGGRPVEGRRARPAPTGPAGGDWDDKKKKKARGAASKEDPPKKARGGGGSFRDWADDWDDDDRET